VPVPAHLSGALADLWASTEATCLRLGMPPAQARAIADRAVEWRETGKARAPSDHAEVRARVETVKAATGGLRIYGWASVVDDGARLVVDHDGDIIPPAELERAAAKALGAPLDVDHRKVEVGRISESMWLDPAKRIALGVPTEGPTGWWIGGEVTDAATIARVESGELRELSMRFRRRRVPLDVTAEKALNPTDVPGLAVLVDLEIADVSLVAEGAGKGVVIRETRKNKETSKMTIEEIQAAIAALSPEDKASLMASLMPPTEAEDKMTPEQAKARAEAETMKARVVALEAQIKRRDIADAVKARIGEVPGATHDDLVSVLVALPEAQRTVVESIARASSEAAKALQTRQGLTAPGSGSIATFDDAYMAAKSKAPKATPDELAAMVAVDHPTLYASRFGRDGGR
jgi:hypothetical protein